MSINANSLFESMQMIAQQAINNSSFDKTVQANISSCVDSAKGKYIIKYQGEYFYAFSNDTSKTYTDGTAVYVLMPGGDSTKQKTIISSIKDASESYIDVIDDSQRYNLISPNLITSLKGDAKLGISSYDARKYILLYSSEESEQGLVESFIDLDEENLAKYILLGDSFQLSADFQTSLPIEQQGSGNYGLKLFLDFYKDDSHTEINTISYELDVDNMIGNPYKFTISTNQIKNYDVKNVKNFIKVKQIYFFEEGFPNTKADQEEDIFISNIKLYVTDGISDSDLKGYYLRLNAPNGLYFTQEMSSTAKLNLKATILLDGKESSTMSNAKNFYWFKENPKIENSSLAYCSYGGRGWECLNTYTVIAGVAGTDTEVREYQKGTGTYSVIKTDIATSYLKYKCVAVFDSTTISNTIIIYNEDGEYIISIVPEPSSYLQNGDVIFENGDGKANLICNVQTSNSGEKKYYWGYTEPNNSFYNLPESTELITEIQNLQTEYDNLVTEYNAGTATAEQVAAAKKLLDDVKAKTRVEGNTIYNLYASDIDSFRNYSCGLYVDNTQVGSASVKVLNKETTPTNSLTLVNGTQAFQYNEKGYAPNSKTLDSPITLKPVTFEIYDSNGNPLTDDAKAGMDIVWTFPKGNSLLKADSDMADYIIEETDDYIKYGNIVKLVYNLQSSYKATSTNNTISLEVKYHDITMVANTNFLFFKAGDDGTNATEYIARITKNTTEEQIRNDYILFKRTKKADGTYLYSLDGGNWMKAELWKDGDRIFNGIETGNSTEGKQVTVKWSLLQNVYNRNCKDDSTFTIDGNTGVINFDSENEHPILDLNSTAKNSSLANLIQVQLTYFDGSNKTTIYATMPIVLVDQIATDKTYKVQLDEGGFLKATYNYEGTSPSYDTTKPLSLLALYNSVDPESGEESWINIDGDEGYQVTWGILGTIANENNTYVDNINLKTNTVKTVENTVSKWFTPIDYYDGYCVTNMIKATINTVSETDVLTPQAVVYIPIHLYLNVYFNNSLNGWNGNNIVANEDGDVVLAPQVGAGVKNQDNTFSGIYMGQIASNSNKKKVGLIGLSSGRRSIFLDAETGKAEFGIEGDGQVIIDPTEHHARIYGGNYSQQRITQWEQKYADVTSNQGMLIDLTTPYIDFGSGTFHVSPLGELTSTSGYIGGWKIKENELLSTSTAAEGNGVAGIRCWNSTDKDEGYAFWAGDEDPSKAEFSVRYNGQVKATNMEWGSVDPETHDMIVIENGKIYSAINGKEHSSLDSAEDGFYLGIDGFSIGGKAGNEENFQVDKEGYAIIKKGIVSVWDIRENGLTSGKTDVTDVENDGLFIGGNGIFAGAAIEENTNGATSISQLGKLYSVKGQLGKWTLDVNGFHGDTINLIPTGTGLSCNIDGTEKWGLHADGTVNLPINPLDLKIEDHALDKVLVGTPEGGLYYCLGYEADDIEDPTGDLEGFVANCIGIYSE